jgi:hypothetical protein
VLAEDVEHDLTVDVVVDGVGDGDGFSAKSGSTCTFS